MVRKIGHTNPNQSDRTGILKVEEVLSQKNFVKEHNLVPSPGVKELAERWAKVGRVDIYSVKCCFTMSRFGRDGSDAQLEISRLPGIAPSVLALPQSQIPGYMSLYCKSTSVLFWIDSDKMWYPVTVVAAPPKDVLLEIVTDLRKGQPGDINRKEQAALVKLTEDLVDAMRKQPWFDSNFLICRDLYI